MISGGLNGGITDLSDDQLVIFSLIAALLIGLSPFLFFGIVVLLYLASLGSVAAALGLMLVAAIAGAIAGQFWDEDSESRVIANNLLQIFMAGLLAAELYALAPLLGVWALIILAGLYIISNLIPQNYGYLIKQNPTTIIC